MNKVVIIGSGCSGLAACYSLSKNKNNKITLITADDSLGKKYLVTGNGRCNIGNINAFNKNYNCYISNNNFIPSFFNEEDLLPRGRSSSLKPAKRRDRSPAAGGSGRRAPCGGAPYKKDPLALKAARGSRTIFGSGLLSHMTLCSIIGDGELNFRVRNGVGCTLSSMATKEISGHLFESGCVARLRALGHGLLCPLPALPAGAPCHIRTSAPKCGNTTEMPLSKY